MATFDNQYLALTPAGVLYAFSQKAANEQQQALQAILAPEGLMTAKQWVERHSEVWLDTFLEENWVELLDSSLTAPSIELERFLQYVVASLSGNRRAAVGTPDKLCIARAGFSQKEAQDMCIAASDMFEFISRQQERRWGVEGQAISFFNTVDTLMPSINFIYLWINNTGYWLVLEDEPLLNNRAFVELVWGIKAHHERATSITEQK